MSSAGASDESKNLRPELTNSEEDCLKALTQLLFEERLENPSPAQIAKVLQTPSKGIASVLKSLSGKGCVIHKPYAGTKLTDLGNRIGMEVLRGHRLLKTMLHTVLHVPWERLSAEADRLKHALSTELLEHLDRQLDQPARDPHGDPIPDANGRLRDDGGLLVPLTECGMNQSARIRRISNQQPEFLRFLQESGIALEVVVKVVANDPVAGILTFAISERSVSLSASAASAILVEIPSKAKAPH